jgi:Xaa-Pro aminopeptidase
MMNDAGNARPVNAVSAAELRRRWLAVRTQMRARQVDALVVQNSSDWVGGYIRWFTNQPATNGYPTTVVFPSDGAMSLIEQGPFDGLRVAADAESSLSGIARRLTTPSYPSVHYSGGYDAELAVRELKALGVRRIGLVAPASMYFSFGQCLTGELARGGVEIVDFTDAVDRIKAIKSEEERTLIQQVATMQDQVMASVSQFLRPGLRDFEVAAYAQYVGQQLGSEQGIFLCSSAPAGQAANFRPRSMQGRTLQRGDVYSLLVENNGPGGYYAELSRILVLGRASQELRDMHATVLDAQRHALTLLVPGASCREIHAQHNEYLRSLNLPAERRVNMHGMGYDMVERPLIRDDEDMQLAQHMAIVCHPGVLNQQMFVHNTELHLIEERGASESLHRTPKQIIELDS